MKVKRRAVFSLPLVTLGLEDRKRSNFRWIIKRILPRHCVIHVIQLSPSCNKSQKQIKWILNKEIVNKSIDIWRQKHNFFDLLNMLMEAILPLYLFCWEGCYTVFCFVLFFYLTKIYILFSLGGLKTKAICLVIQCQNSNVVEGNLIYFVFSYSLPIYLYFTPLSSLLQCQSAKRGEWTRKRLSTCNFETIKLQQLLLRIKPIEAKVKRL